MFIHGALYLDEGDEHQDRASGESTLGRTDADKVGSKYSYPHGLSSPLRLPILLFISFC